MVNKVKVQHEPRICDNPACGEEYTPARTWQLYCSPECRDYRLSLERLNSLEKVVKAARELTLVSSVQPTETLLQTISELEKEEVMFRHWRDKKRARK